MLRVLFVNNSFAHMWLKSFYTNFNVRLIKTFNIKSISVNDYKDEHQQLTSRKLLNPFFHGNNDSAEFKPVILHAKQLFCFYAVFFLNFSLYAANVATLFYIVQKEIDNNYPKWRVIDYLGLSAQLASQYCAIISCFIFSKLAYAVASSCRNKLTSYQNIVQELAESAVVLQRLEEEDTQFVKLCNGSTKPYRLWFSVHWFMYGLTAFMSIAYFVDTIIDCKHNYDKCYLIILYVFLFTLEHIVLFLYPCFRAASILEARNTLIHKVSKQNWSPDIKSKFLQFMKEQKCGFVLSLVCIRVEFGFNVAYISIFLMFIGIVIKVFSLT